MSIFSTLQIANNALTAAQLGITKVRLTGGEPLKLRNIEDLVGSLSRI